MAKKKRKKKPAKTSRKNANKSPSRQHAEARSDVSPGSRETRAAEAMTVGWMLSAVATLMGTIAGGAVWLALSSQDGTLSQEAIALPLVLLFTAQVSGLVALVLTPVIHYIRVDKPPKLVTCVVLAIIAIPWLMAMLLPSPQG